MPGYKEIWPLALLLATASGTSQAGAPVDTSPATFFRAGSLSDALQNAAKASEEANEEAGGPAGPDRIQLAQWFNFFNCFSGVWRKC